jgi:hypothetical protein
MTGVPITQNLVFLQIIGFFAGYLNKYQKTTKIVERANVRLLFFMGQR